MTGFLEEIRKLREKAEPKISRIEMCELVGLETRKSGDLYGKIETGQTKVNYLQAEKIIKFLTKNNIAEMGKLRLMPGYPEKTVDMEIKEIEDALQVPPEKRRNYGELYAALRKENGKYQKNVISGTSHTIGIISYRETGKITPPISKANNDVYLLRVAGISKVDIAFYRLANATIELQELRKKKMPEALYAFRHANSTTNNPNDVDHSFADIAKSAPKNIALSFRTLVDIESGGVTPHPPQVKAIMDYFRFSDEKKFYVAGDNIAARNPFAKMPANLRSAPSPENPRFVLAIEAIAEAYSLTLPKIFDKKEMVRIKQLKGNTLVKAIDEDSKLLLVKKLGFGNLPDFEAFGALALFAQNVRTNNFAAALDKAFEETGRQKIVIAPKAAKILGQKISPSLLSNYIRQDEKKMYPLPNKQLALIEAFEKWNGEAEFYQAAGIKVQNPEKFTEIQMHVEKFKAANQALYKKSMEK